ncbi:MAG: hypothetical protein APF78_01155 [Sphingomonadales bacterium BRH_c3]|nr:MAG: hypothetical protein APF78_01155 [Sphingomonadales bacterium BRH_c3]
MPRRSEGGLIMRGRELYTDHESNPEDRELHEPLLENPEAERAIASVRNKRLKKRGLTDRQIRRAFD